MSLLSLAALGIQLLAFTSGANAKKYQCPPLGVSLPAAKAPSSSEAVASAAQVAQEWFASLTAGFEETAVSLTVKSIHENEPLLDLHHTPSKSDDRSVSEVDAQTVYRVASISKLFPALAALQIAEINMDDPVTKYLPELRDLAKQQDNVNELTTIAWDDITVGSLASHMGGFGSDMATDIANTPGLDPSILGLPELHESEAPECSIIGTPCTKEDFFSIFGRHRPSFGVFTTPLYSNPAFSVLGWVVEAATGESFESFVEKNILNMANMTSTSTGEKPADGTGFIPVGDIMWDTDLGFMGPAGAFYSNTEDLTNLGKAILQNRLLSPAETRKWMQPTEHTSSLVIAYGRPWEIMRTQGLTTDGRVIDIYTKSGNLPPYNGILALIPELGVTFALLFGGPELNPAEVTVGAEQVAQMLIPALDEAGKEEARVSLVGTYTDEESNSMITLDVNDGPGLLVTDMVMRGVDILANFGLFTGAEGDLNVTLRLYPSGLEADGQLGFWGVFDARAIDVTEDVDDALSSIPYEPCDMYLAFEGPTYGMNSIGNFVISVEEDGLAEWVEARFWRVKMGVSERDVSEIQARAELR